METHGRCVLTFDLVYLQDTLFAGLLALELIYDTSHSHRSSHCEYTALRQGGGQWRGLGRAEAEGSDGQ